MPKNANLEKHNPTIARLLEVILSMSEEQQKTILKHTTIISIEMNQ